MKNYEFDLNEYLDDLEYLVNIDSGTENIDGVKQVSDFFTRKFTQLGWEVKTHHFNDSVAPCIELINTDSNNKDILLLGHTDTVFPSGTVKDRPFEIEGDKAYGPGVMDMKSGLLSIYYTIKSINPENLPSVCIALNSHEETSSTSAYPWIEELAKSSRVAFVIEPARANGALVNQRKGLAKYRIELTGVAAHAGVEPEKGRSAIAELGHWIVGLNSITGLQPETTLNVGVIGGGTAANVVAEKAKATLDVRFRDQKDLEKLEGIMAQMAETPIVDGTRAVVRRLGWRPPMNPSEETRRLCRLTEEIAHDFGIEINWASTGGGSDANFTAAVGTPTIDGLGPIGGGAHGAKEYLEISSIEPRIKLLRELILKA